MPQLKSMDSLAGKNLVIACGGTGGHLFPGIAVAEAWRNQGGDVLLLISEKQIDTLATEGFDHLRFERMPSIALPPLLSPKMCGFLIGFFKALSQCRRLFKSFGADAVLGMGGFTSAAPLAAGKMAGKPTFVHESNAIPGRANLLNAKFSESVLVGFDVCAPRFGGRNTKVVGTPLRPAVVKKPPRYESQLHFGLAPDKKTVMIMGGSQGATRLNELVAESLPRLAAAGLQILHITGPQDFEEVNAVFESVPGAGKAIDFCSDVQCAYAASDLAICRSGASTLTELAYYEIPSVLIPYPFAADDHQTANAEIFFEPGAAELWKQSDLDEETFPTRLIELMNDDEKLNQMHLTMKTLAIPDASERVCEVIADAVSKEKIRQ